MIVSGLKGEMLPKTVDSCIKCDKRVMANSVLCSKCGTWEHGK